MADYFNFQSGSLELLAISLVWVYSKDTKSATRIAAVSPYLTVKRPSVSRLGGLFTFANRKSNSKASQAEAQHCYETFYRQHKHPSLLIGFLPPFIRIGPTATV